MNAKSVGLSILLGTSLLIFSCSKKEEASINVNTIEIGQIDKKATESIEKFISGAKYKILKTGDKFFAEITKLIIQNDRIYLLDGDRGQIILIYDLDGNLLNFISKTGSGPGEYRQPTDLWINLDGTIELLDEAQRKIITYSKNGDFINEMKLPFAAEKFIKTNSKYFFYTNNIAFSFKEDSNETGLVISTNLNLTNPEVIVPADMLRADFYYVTTQNFTQVNNSWYFFDAFSNRLINLSEGEDIILDFGELNFPTDFFTKEKKRGIDVMNDLYNLGKVWDIGAIYDTESYLYFKFQINLTVYMAFYDKEKGTTNVIPRDNWNVNMDCFVSRFDPLTAINNQLVFHLLPSQIKMLKELNCFPADKLKDIDENNVLMFWDIN
ncbi:6-bladed beta-propeller [Roseivirga echinicomitans]|uniref:6-bladed beta-propeller n=1 Tax=Roseivirga echinicomitans TaxID=296218 RepID=A0A150XE31_9BACT|nr:6-bladed beta-propeller [Roseivirga echinicomitans]KYG76961.1 hypothetical protein AWN68_18430 [Roseivirga echinicomitans]